MDATVRVCGKLGGKIKQDGMVMWCRIDRFTEFHIVSGKGNVFTVIEVGKEPVEETEEVTIRTDKRVHAVFGFSGGQVSHDYLPDVEDEELVTYENGVEFTVFESEGKVILVAKPQGKA